MAPSGQWLVRFRELVPQILHIFHTKKDISMFYHPHNCLFWHTGLCMKIYTFFFLFFLPFFIGLLRLHLFCACTNGEQISSRNHKHVFRYFNANWWVKIFSSFIFLPSPTLFSVQFLFFSCVLLCCSFCRPRGKTSVNCCWAKIMVKMDEWTCGSWPAWQGKGSEQFWKLFTSNISSTSSGCWKWKQREKSAMKTLV